MEELLKIQRPADYGEITFTVPGPDGAGIEVIRLTCDGDILVKGKLIERDKEFVDALREWFKGVRHS